MQVMSEPFRCTERELFCLATLMSGRYLLGIADPFPGWLTEEIQEAMEDTVAVLTQRQIVTQTDSGTVVQPEIAILVDALTHCDVAITTSLAKPLQPPQQRQFYFRRPQVLEVSQQQENGVVTYLLTPLGRHPTRIYEEIVGWWDGLAYPAAGEHSLVIREDALVKAQRKAMADGEFAAEELLVSIGIPEAAAQSMSVTLATSSLNGALAFTRLNEDGWQTEGLGMLAGVNGLWCLHSVERAGEHCIECVPCDAKGLHAKILSLLGRFFYD